MRREDRRMAAQGSSLACIVALVCAISTATAARPAFLTLPGEKPDDFKGVCPALQISCALLRTSECVAGRPGLITTLM